MDGDKLNAVVKARAGCLALVIAYADQPTYTLEDSSGERYSRVAQLCEEASQDEHVSYWRDRCRKAEARLKCHYGNV